jgi:hypothetical protein
MPRTTASMSGLSPFTRISVTLAQPLNDVGHGDNSTNAKSTRTAFSRTAFDGLDGASTVVSIMGLCENASIGPFAWRAVVDPRGVLNKNGIRFRKLALKRFDVASDFV